MNTLKIINPATEEIIRELQEDTLQMLEQKFELLSKAQPEWEHKTLKSRIEILEKFSSLLEKNINELAGILTSEVGKPLQQSRNEINGARTRIKWLCSNAEKYLSDELMTDEKGMQEKLQLKFLLHPVVQ